MRQVSFKLIEFNVYDDNNTKSDNFNKYRDNREFMVQMFGINSKGQTASIYVEGFNPFFYVKVDDSWDNSKKTCFVNEIKAMMGPYYEDSIIKSQFVEKKNLYGFDAGKLHNFIVIIFKNTMALNKAKKLWYKEIITETTYTKFLKPKGYIFEDTSVYLYEGHIPPLLRLFHIREISPSGWIALPESRYLKHDKLQKTTYCDYEYTINYRYIVPLEKNVLVPYKQCSFDIEASSSHGDFPLAIKHYKKLAMDIVNRLYYEKSERSDKHDKSDKPEKNQLADEETLNQMILTAFKVPISVDFPYPEINVVYPKKKVSRAEITKLFNDFIMMYPATIKVNKNDTDDDIALANGAVDDDDSDEEDDVTNQEIAQNTELEEAPSYFNKKKVRSYTNRKATILDILNDQACEYTTQIKELSKTLTHIFPQLEGDKVTFIGSSFKKYGEDRPYLNHCIVLNGCVIPEGAVENSVIVTCDTEREVLLEWTKLIQAENPDIVTGYNITTFDFPFMDDRSQELNCRQEFLKLSRNRDEVCLNRNWKTGEETLETNKIVLASGEYSLKYIKMTGRLIVDLYIHFRKEYQLPSNKLDAVSGHFIGDDVNSIEHINIGQGKTIIKTKNLKGLDVGGYVNFLEISYSEDFYKKGKKFMITNINMESHEFTISGIEHLDMTKKVRWGLAKDDVSPQDIFRLSNGSDEDRGIVAKYCIKDCTLVQNLMDKIDLLTGYVEMAGYCSVPMSFLVFRGQGIKLTSYVAKKCREKDTLMPTIEKAENDGGYEGAIVLPPKCDIYLEDPVACVDYSSLYPSSIISENISHDSKVWTCEYNLEGEIIKECGERNEDGTYRYDNLPEYKYVDVTYDTYHYIRKTLKAAITKERCGYKICRFAQFPDGKAILPAILEELLVARKTTKKLMAKEEDPFMKNVYNKRQETIKVTANSVYGQTGARTSTFYDKDVAASTTATGRKLLIYARTVIETGYKNRVVKLKNEREVKTNAEYVYGDTDSVFFKFNLKDLDGNKIVNREALEITIELAKDAGQLATKYLKAPHDLEYEKTFLPFILLSKKRYVGMLYEDDPDKGKIKFMGIVLKRRDNAPIVKDIYGGIIDKIIKERSMEKAIRYCKECLQNMVNEVYPIEKLMITKALRGYYKNPKQIAHNVLANRIGEREQGNRPTAGDRIKYVYIQTDMKHALQGDKIETPEYIVANSLKINYAFYITNQIMKPILQLFALGLEDMPAFKKRHGHSLSKWYNILIELQIKWDLDDDKFAKKLDELKGKEVKALVFDEYLNMLR